MRRLYFLLPDLDTTHQVIDKMLLARVEERHLHVIASEGASLGDLPEASLIQKRDFDPAMERGVALGGAPGMMAGIAALAMPGVVIAGGAILAMSLLGAGMGAWMGCMIGMDVDNSHVQKFKSAVEEGQVLVLVDVPKDRVDEIHGLVRGIHPDADFAGTEPSIPAFP